MRRALVGVGSIALVGGMLGFWAGRHQAPGPPAQALVVEQPPLQRRVQPERRRHAKVHKVARKAEPRKAEPRKVEPVVPPQERARIRSDFREDRLLALDQQLDAYAAEAGWDPELTEEVRSLLVESVTHIGQQLSRVDQGQVDWARLRPMLRAYRLERAAELQALLGDEFDPFVQSMAFGRFLGQPPPGPERFDPYK